MATKAEQRRQKKKKDRERKIRRDVNVRRNNTPGPKYRLDILLDEVWRQGVMAFKTWEAVLAHQAETEKRRAAGEQIAEGKVIELDTGELKMTIEASKPMKGALPDKLADKPEAAAKAIIDNKKDLPDNLKP